MEIQECLIATIQRRGEIKGVTQPISGMIKDFMVMETNGIMSLGFARAQFNEIQKKKFFKREL